ADPCQVLLDGDLAGVLATATDEEVDLLGQLVAGVVLVDDGCVPVPPDPRREAAGVAQVAVDAHLAGVHVHEVDLALALPAGSGRSVGALRLAEDGHVTGVVHASAPFVPGASTPISGRS